MQPPLLTTKLYFPPVRPGLVQRPRLLDRLQAGLRGPLILVSAPAGSGKTTLLSEWRVGPGSGVPVAWVSLEASDNDLLRFFQYLAAALDLVQPGIADKVTPLLQPSEQPDAEAILTLLVNTLNGLAHDFVLVLDDYHLIETTSIHQALAFLLNHPPQSMHLVLLTRSDPPLPLARLRARGQLMEIRVEHLRFTVEECAQFLNRVMGLDLTSEQIAALEKRTEGWVAGLQLAALSIQGREDTAKFIEAFSGSHQYIVDYLGEEVLNRQPVAVREFLLRTSILERLTASLCNALTGLDDGQEILDSLAQHNLFLISLDNDRRWYRFHHLFADLLHNQLQTRFPELMVELHHKAAIWYENNHLTHAALNHALSAKDFSHAEQLVYKHWSEWVNRINLSVNIESLQRIPNSILRAAPRLSLINGWMKWSSGKAGEAKTHAETTQRMISDLLESGKIREDHPDHRLLVGEMNVLFSFIATTNREFNDAVQYAKRAIQVMPKDEKTMFAGACCALSYAYQEAGEIDKALDLCEQTLPVALDSQNSGVYANAIRNLALTYKIQGRLQDALITVKQALEYAKEKELEEELSLNIIYLSLADIYYEQNDLQKAEQYLRTSERLIKQAGFFVNSLLSSVVDAKIKRADGEAKKAVTGLQSVLTTAKQDGVILFIRPLKAFLARLQCETGDLSAPLSWMNSLMLMQGDRLGYEQGEEAVQCAFILYSLNRIDEVKELLAWIETTSQASQNKSCLLEAILLQGLIWHQYGTTYPVVERMQYVLSVAEEEGYVRKFLDHGKPMQALLKTILPLIHDEPSSATIRKLLGAFEPDAGGSQSENQPAHTILSRREIELLALVAAGRSNKEIAAELYISIGTVKRHTVNIFNKLDVKNRTEAVAKARMLGLL